MAATIPTLMPLKALTQKATTVAQKLQTSQNATTMQKASHVDPSSIPAAPSEFTGQNVREQQKKPAEGGLRGSLAKMMLLKAAKTLGKLAHPTLKLVAKMFKQWKNIEKQLGHLGNLPMKAILQDLFDRIQSREELIAQHEDLMYVQA